MQAPVTDIMQASTRCRPTASPPAGGVTPIEMEHVRPNEADVSAWPSQPNRTVAPGQPLASVWYVIVTLSVAWPCVGETASDEVASAIPVDRTSATRAVTAAVAVRHAARSRRTTLDPSTRPRSGQQNALGARSSID